MTLAVPARVFSFDEFARQNHRHFPGDRLDAQFAAHADAISSIQAFLAKAFRTDGQLLNGAITPETLSPDLVAEITENLRQEFKSDLDKAHRAAEEARIDAENARRDLHELQILTSRAIDAAVEVRGGAGSALQEVRNLENRAQVASEVLAARQANVMSLQATVLAGAGSSEEWSVASMQWAEHMGGPLPAETIAWMGITGDHWSSRWWANQATLILDQIQDVADGAIGSVDDFEDLYLGAKSGTSPTVDNDGDALQVGAMYFDLDDNIMYVWTGTTWQPLSGDVGVVAAESLGTGTQVYQGVSAGVLQFNSLRGAGTNTLALSAGTITISGRFTDWTEIPNKPPTFPATAHTHVIADVTGLQTALNGKEPSIAMGTTSQYWRGDKVWSILDKAAVGLPNVDNTSDPNKPMSNATKAYVDAANAAQDTVANGKVAKAGDTMTGYLTLNANPVSPLHAATKAYIDNKPSGATMGDVPPVTPGDGQFWFETDSGNLFVSYNDGNSQQWVDVSGSSALANYLPLTGGTLSGDLLLNKATAGDSRIIQFTQAGVPKWTINNYSDGTLSFTNGAIDNPLVLFADNRVQLGGTTSFATTNVTGNMMFPKPLTTDSRGVYFTLAGKNEWGLVNGDKSFGLLRHNAAGVGVDWPFSVNWTTGQTTFATGVTHVNQVDFPDAGGAPVAYSVPLNFSAAGISSYLREYHQPGVAAGLQIVCGASYAQFASNGDFTITGASATKASGTTWANPSDLRIKEDIHDYPTGLDEICKLRPVTFRFKSTTAISPDLRVGLIAQEAEKVMPGIVTTTKGGVGVLQFDDFKSLDASNVLWALVNSVKTLHTRVSTLEGAV